MPPCSFATVGSSRWAACHGAGASAFSDWWAFKFEVLDAIPYAGSILRERGVNVSFNSDSSDHARRLNLEAAKAVKYGGTPPEESLRFVNLNPARQLRVDHPVGSLEPGKHGDFAVWSGHPLASSSVCLQTLDRGTRGDAREPPHAALRTLSKPTGTDGALSWEDAGRPRWVRDARKAAPVQRAPAAATGGNPAAQAQPRRSNSPTPWSLA